jgi:hypothetical protein
MYQVVIDSKHIVYNGNNRRVAHNVFNRWCLVAKYGVGHSSFKKGVDLLKDDERIQGVAVV